MLTDDTITDDQIRALKRRQPFDASVYNVAARALGEMRPLLTMSKEQARAWCATLVNVERAERLTDQAIRELRDRLRSRGKHDDLELGGMVATYDALGRSHRRMLARAKCAELRLVLAQEDQANG